MYAYNQGREVTLTLISHFELIRYFSMLLISSWQHRLEESCDVYFEAHGNCRETRGMQACCLLLAPRSSFSLIKNINHERGSNTRVSRSLQQPLRISDIYRAGDECFCDSVSSRVDNSISVYRWLFERVLKAPESNRCSDRPPPTLW